MLGKSGQILATDATACDRANERLHLARGLIGRLNLPGLTAALSIVHVSRRPYARGHRVRLHQHAQLQIQATITGRFRFETAEHAVPLNPGHACVIEPTRPHQWRCARRGVLMGLLLDCEGPAVEHARDFAEREGHAPLRLLRDAETVESLSRVVEAATAPPSALAIERLGFALGTWLTHVFEQGCSHLPRQAATPAHQLEHTWTSPDPQWGAKACERAIEFMHANLHHRIRLQEIANEAGVSPRHLSRLFRLNHGCSVHEHLTELRLRQAQRQLRADPERPVKTIAYECGFQQAGYLTRCYRRRFGCAPSADR